MNQKNTKRLVEFAIIILILLNIYQAFAMSKMYSAQDVSKLIAEELYNHETGYFASGYHLGYFSALSWVLEANESYETKIKELESVQNYLESKKMLETIDHDYLYEKVKEW